MENYEFIINFFKSIGALKESDMYLKLFQRGNPARFAVIKVGGKVLAESKNMMALDLAFLCNLDLFPIVIHGGGPQIDAELQSAGIPFEKRDGIRVTPREALSVIQSVLDRNNQELVDAIREHGGAAAGFTQGIFQARHMADSSLGEVGEVTGVNLKPLERAIRRDEIPIVSPLGFDPDGNPLNVNADSAARALVLGLRPKKFILITEEGGVLDESGKLIPFINLALEFDRMVSNGHVTGGMLLKFREIRNLIEETPGGKMTAVITSAQNLLRELFTVKGRGTFVKRGAVIETHRSYRGVNKRRLKHLIEVSFGKKLKPGYFAKPIQFIFVDRNYKGAALVRKVSGMYYLDKFAVRKEAQGEGIGRDVWSVMKKRCPNLFWRSKPGNPINGWYAEQAHGLRKFDNWWVFWIGLNERQISKSVRYCRWLEESMKTSPPAET
ncbi:MAG: acetylglutamate kinase [Planctomycetes bacterium]|nr:acetylglutamate kinase [Planctomycetota bacterium]